MDSNFEGATGKQEMNMALNLTERVNASDRYRM